MSNEWPESEPEEDKQASQEAAAKRQWNERYRSEHPNPEAKPLTPVVAFFEQYESRREALTFDDVLMPNERMSDFSAADVCLASLFSHNVGLKVPPI